METIEQKENKTKQRFKGVENFLRRIAFNLGNTPSQTEVKIISCIPIDVTDLQQKIIQLERQLDGAGAASKQVKETEPEPRKSATGSRKESAAKDNKSAKELADTKNGKEDTETKTEKDVKEEGTKKSQKKTSVVNAVFYDPNFDYSSTSASKKVECEEVPESGPCTDYTAKQRKSTVSFIFPVLPNNNKNCSFSSDDAYNGNKEKCTGNLRKNLFSTKKKSPKKQKNRTELVYYADTQNLQFQGNKALKTSDNINNPVNRVYLNNTMKKQFKLGVVLENLSRVSEFSSPVCRDEEQFYHSPCPYESDICSCFHGPFENTDNVKNKRFSQFRKYPSSVANDRRAYYDTSLYDMIPVRDKPLKLNKNIIFSNKKDNKIDKCRLDAGTELRFQPYLVNYNTIASTKNIPHIVKLNNNKDIKTTIKKRDRKRKIDEQLSNDTSNSCYVDLGKVQMKRVNKITKNKIVVPVEPVYKNAECLTTIANNTDCQTTSFNLGNSITVDKTEDTLNNIKNILQAVLTEVRTNSQMKTIDGKSKKDAFVQNVVSQSNVQQGCSKFLNSLTYSPFNMNPYDAACSRQMPAGHPCCSIQHPLKCIHNYPVFIQSAGRPKCSSCFRSSQIAKYQAKNVTTATNTDDVKDGKNNETEKLIKEIYKSIAVTMDLPTKDTSYSNYDDFKSSGTTAISTYRTYSKSNDDKELKIAISEIFKKPTQRDTSGTQQTVTPLNSRLVSNSVSVQSQAVSTEDDRRDRRYVIKRSSLIEESDENDDYEDEEVDNEIDDKSTASDSNNKESIAELQCIGAVDHDLESENDSGPENDVLTIGSIKKKKKGGLLSKMFKTVFKSKGKQSDTIVKSVSSDSDDYQTIYSQKVEKVSRQRPQKQKKKSHPKVVYRKQHKKETSPERYTRTPYLEQEYRRQWNEKLMFKERARRYSSEQPISAESTPRRPLYYQNYEARSVMVEPNRLYPPTGYSQPIANGKNHETLYQEIRPECRYEVQDFGLRKRVSPRKVTGKGLSWLKKHKTGLHCGAEWKKLVLEG